MKKLYLRINNRITSRQNNSPSNPRKSGFYDVQEAEKEYEINGSVSKSVLVSDSCSEEDSKFDNARSSLADSVYGGSEEDGVYADIDLKKENDETHEVETSEYDVPRISFKFFEKNLNNQRDSDNMYENVTGDDVKLPRVSSPISVTPSDDSKVPIDKPSTPVPRLRSEMKITMTAVDIDIGEGTTPYPEEELKKIEKLGQSKSRSVSHEYVSSTSIQLIKPTSVYGMKKCESFPSIFRDQKDDDDDDEENFYKVPRCLKRNRLSQSLKDFEAEDVDLTSRVSNGSSIQSLAIKTPILNRVKCSEETNGSCDSENSSNRRRNLKSFLKKPRHRLQVLKTRFNNIMNDQAALQRVGAFEDKPKITINLDEVLKNSKMKCKDMLKTTGKFFHKKKSSGNSSTFDSIDDHTMISSTPAKTDLTASDIQYKLNISDRGENIGSDKENNEVQNSEVDLGDSGLMTPKFGKIGTPVKGQNGFEDLRRYVKHGSDFCKELATILQDRAEAETAYAKSLSKLSVKLTRVCRDGVGTLNEGWKAVAQELESRAESHRILGAALLEESAKPLKSMSESQQKCRKLAESSVDRAAKSLSDLRQNEAKNKKNSHVCARENEKLQDAALIDTSRLSRSTSLIHLGNIQKVPTERDNAKLEIKRRKAEENTKKADIEYYDTCVKAERTRLEWESAVLRGVDTFQSLEEERLNCLKNALESYIHHSSELNPRLNEVTERLKLPVAQSEPTKDLSTFLSLRQTSQQVSEQLLPDFYCEHITLAMNRERRKTALHELLNFIRKDIECERKQKNGVENMSKAIKQNPTFGAKDAQTTFTEKLYHVKSMLIYFEATRYKIQNALAELDSKPRNGHPLASHITITRDKSGLQQSVLKVPQWLREELIDCNKSPVSEKSMNSAKSDPQIHEIEDRTDWSDRGAADGNSNQHDSDFDEFSSQCSSTAEDNIVEPVAQCKALYHYTPNFTDELELNPGDLLSVYRKQADGWWLGECKGNVGIFPATYVEVIPT